jgi:predicted Zn-dependent protease
VRPGKGGSAPAAGLLVAAVLLCAAAAVPLPARQASTRTLHFVGIGSVKPGLIEHLVSYFDRAFDLKIEVLPALSLDGQAVDEPRGQAIAEELITTIRRRYTHLVRNPNARVIGITPRDMFILAMQKRWRFAFSLRGDDRRFAVISYARMDPVAYGQPPNEELLRSRLRKMVMKDIGVMYYGLPLSNDPRSVMYSNILGIDDLDRMTEQFAPK